MPSKWRLFIGGGSGGAVGLLVEGVALVAMEGFSGTSGVVEVWGAVVVKFCWSSVVSIVCVVVFCVFGCENSESCESSFVSWSVFIAYIGVSFFVGAARGLGAVSLRFIASTDIG